MNKILNSQSALTACMPTCLPLMSNFMDCYFCARDLRDIGCQIHVHSLNKVMQVLILYQIIKIILYLYNIYIILYYIILYYIILYYIILYYIILYYIILYYIILAHIPFATSIVADTHQRKQLGSSNIAVLLGVKQLFHSRLLDMRSL